MNVKQGQATDLPGLIQTSADGTAVTGIAYNAAGLVISYQKNGGAVQIKTLSAADWHEGVDGSYNIRFSASELDTLGLFSFWVSYTDASTYPGAAIVESVPSTESLDALQSSVDAVQMALDGLATSASVAAIKTELDSVQAAIEALPTDIATSASVAAIKTELDSVQAAIEALPTDVATSASVAAIKTELDSVQTAITGLASSSDLAALSSTVDDLKTMVDTIPTDVATSASVAAIKTELDSVQAAIEALPTDVATSASVAAIKTELDSVQASIASLASSSDLAALSSTVDGLRTVVDTIPTDVATSASVAAINTKIDSVQSSISALPTDVASSASVAAIKTELDSVQAAIEALPSVDLSSLTALLNDLTIAVEAIPTDVATGTSVAALQTSIDNLASARVSLDVGYSMNVTQNKAVWLPLRLINKTTGASNTGVSFDAVTVSYQKSGETVKTKTLTIEQWSEGVDGAYSIYFLADELDKTGMLGYWIEQADSVTYPGIVQVVEINAGPGKLEKTMRVTVKGQPIAACEVWVTTDEAGKDKIAGPRLTNVIGVVSFMLDPGVYWIYWVKSREVEYSKMRWEVKSNA